MSQNLPVPEDDALANVLMDLAAQGVTQASIFTAAAALTQSVAYEYDALPLKFEHSTLYVALDENDSATVKNLSAAVRFKVIVLANIDLRLIRRLRYPRFAQAGTPSEARGE